MIGSDIFITLEELELSTLLQKIKIWKRLAENSFQLLSSYSNSKTVSSEYILSLAGWIEQEVPHFLEIR